eukprot:9134899-Lingulodinium_polyedra.AAC.1
MMRARGQRFAPQTGPMPLGPPFQCSAPTLLYHADAVEHVLPWRCLPMDRVVTAIRGLLPTADQEGWRQ